jgi:hypothetical protein
VKLRTLTIVIIAAFGFAAPGYAQTPPPIDQNLARPPGLEPVPDGPPDLPKNDSITNLPHNPEVHTDPNVTIRQDGENKIEEYRVNGRLYAIRVTPKVGPPYTMVDNKGDGHFEPSDPAGVTVRPPRWTLLEF